MINDQNRFPLGRVVATSDLLDGIRLWIITEADRSATTVLLPEDN